MWVGVVASDLKIAVGLEVPSRFVGLVLARLATGVGAGVIVAHRTITLRRHKCHSLSI